MNARGMLCLAATVTALASACTSADDGADELRDIREVVAQDAEDPGIEVDGEPPTDEGTEVVEPAEGASAEAPEDDEEPPETSDIDITVVPDEITVEYVQAVVDELERIYAEALVLLMEEGELTIEVSDRVGEIFATRQVDLRRGEFVDVARDGFPGMRPVGEVQTRRRVVQEILDEGEGCVYVETLTDDQVFFEDPVEPVEVFLILEFPDVERPVDINPTPWVYGALGVGEREEMEAVKPCSE